MTTPRHYRHVSYWKPASCIRWASLGQVICLFQRGYTFPQCVFPTATLTQAKVSHSVLCHFDYDAPWWRDFSYWVREQKGWTCDECGISLKDNHEMVHAHHAKGINRHTLADPQALCIGCHAEQPGWGHQKIKETRTYGRFMDRYGERWRAYRDQN